MPLKRKSKTSWRNVNKLDLNSLKWRKKPLEKKKKTYSTQCVMKSLTLPSKTLLISLTLITLVKNQPRKLRKKNLRNIFQPFHLKMLLMRFGHNSIIQIHYQKKSQNQRHNLLNKWQCQWNNQCKQQNLLLRQNQHLLQPNQWEWKRFTSQQWASMTPLTKSGHNLITQPQWQNQWKKLK